MNKLTPKDQKAKEIAAIETALAETRADIMAGRVVKESAAAHVERMKKCVALVGKGKEKGDALGGAPEDDWEALS